MIDYYSRFFGQASTTTGQNLPIRSHRLLVGAGYIRESVAGRYYLLPLGLRVFRRLEAIIRTEMDRAGAFEVVAPVLHPLELWRETNRDQAVGFELMRIKDRRGAEFALGGTAEEMFVDLVRKFNFSYKDLPLNLYQFGWKFRDEARARGGLLRLREFVMKDAYSFSTEDQFETIYEDMKRVYGRIFSRVGLETTIVAADGGYIGGDYCHEFVVESDVGESLYYVADDGSASHQDVACFKKPDRTQPAEAPLKKVAVKRGATMAAALEAHKGTVASDHIKNVAYSGSDGRLIVAVIRSEFDINEAKLARAVGGGHLTPLDQSEIETELGSVAGFISPVGLQARPGRQLVVVADDSVNGVGFISGANEVGYDYCNIAVGRDFKADIVADIALIPSTAVSESGGRLQAKKGIEVGNIFQLGYHYSQAMTGAVFSDRHGRQVRYYMGCYGIGLARTLAAVAEVYADDAGLCWPAAIAPYDILVVCLEATGAEAATAAATELDQAGATVLVDDRDGLRPGAKLATADLLGIPLIIIISQRHQPQQKIEIKLRQRGTAKIIDRSHLIQFWQDYQADLKKAQKEPQTI